MSIINRMSVAEFRAAGYLQEVNRRFLHPLGLALEVIVDDDGTELFGQVWDGRDDPEGWAFGPEMIDADKAQRIEAELQAKAEYRRRSLGYVIQPAREEHPMSDYTAVAAIPNRLRNLADGLSRKRRPVCLDAALAIEALIERVRELEGVIELNRVRANREGTDG